MIDLVDPFIPFLVGGLVLTFILCVIAFCFGISKGEKNAETRFSIERKILHDRELAAFNEGHKQGVREATPKHDPKTGQFVPKVS